MLYLRSLRAPVTWIRGTIARLANKRVFPAVDIMASSTRREDLLLDKEVLQKIWILRNYLTDMNSVEAMEFLRDRLVRNIY